MTLKERIVADLTAAMKAKDADRLAVLRMLKSKMMEAEVAQREKKGLAYVLEDPEAQAVIGAYAKQRRDSIDAYRQGGREDLAAKEEAEIAILSEYLPQQLSEAEIRLLVDEGIAATGASSARDLGKVMGWLAPRTRGRADGKQVSALVAQSLAAADLVAHDTGGHRA